MALSDPAALSAKLGHAFDRPELLAEALTHASAGASHDYQRLEFLGDRVLALVVADMLVERFSDEPEGDLSRRLVALVRGRTLTRVAREIGLGDHLVLSAGEADAGAHKQAGILADALEAVIAAIYLDGGLEAAERFIVAHWTPVLDDAELPARDAKTELQEWAQARALALPAYRVINRSGSDHAPTFTVEVKVAGRPAEAGAGSSKRAGEQAAAARLLARIGEAADD